MAGATMMAVRVHAFGGPEELRYEKVPVPRPGPGEVLVRVHAAGVNPPDWYGRTGFANIPEAIRVALSLPFTPGSDISGEIVALGPDVTGWSVGEAVLGLVRFPSRGGRGEGYAQYATAPVTDLARKPAGLDHVRAAGVPMAGLTAYQFLYDHLGLGPGDGKGRTVLVNGAAGGVGHFTVQLAKVLGAEVVGVASTRHREFLAGLGADRFVDYTATPVEDVVRDVDHLVDTVGGPDAHRLLPVVRRGGTISPVFLGEYHRERAQRLGIDFRSGQVHSDGAQLAELVGLIDQGLVQVGVDSVFPLARAAEAHQRAERGHLQGKIVLRVAEDW
ncbi:NADP-dependent oxidoreductase [Kitasatospora sp. NBC_00240]|uniref:NADP-dependent oxidoreductase n=1 Tax=Kitasatospora sp. NBC_00240 TaxID=2903567 RepID=UPI0022550880|nr:NADP-dependent oxidoreductase [Kitasatospora sp. NBC_00240]MCX5213094.1 NADP-dependent oxidoreductase [Kitasatospora sp. NBC_00240]